MSQVVETRLSFAIENDADDLPHLQKLAAKIKAGPIDVLPLHDNPYLDWSAHLFEVGITQFIILTNTKSLYSCVMYGSGVTSTDILVEHALTTIREFMQDDAEQLPYRKHIAPACGTVQFAKALNRSVTGSMNDLINEVHFQLGQKHDLSPHELGFILNGTLLSALATEPRGYGKPKEAFRRLGCIRQDQSTDRL